MNDIVERLDRTADEAPEELSALPIEAADTTLMLRELMTIQDETWLEGVSRRGKPEKAYVYSITAIGIVTRRSLTQRGMEQRELSFRLK